MDVTVYGCIDSARWTLRALPDGDEDELAVAWSPKIIFPHEGEFRITGCIGGPGGDYAGYRDLTVSDNPAEGGGRASGAAGASTLGAAMVPALAIASRRGAGEDRR